MPLKYNIVDVKSEEYAREAFNADRVVEFIVDADIYFMGEYYKHKQVIFAGKGENVVIIYCYYTDKGFTNKEKYKIESILKFQ